MIVQFYYDELPSQNNQTQSAKKGITIIESLQTFLLKVKYQLLVLFILAQGSGYGVCEPIWEGRFDGADALVDIEQFVLEEALTDLQQLFGIALELGKTEVESIIEFVLFITQLAVFLRQQIDVRVFLSLPKAIIFCCLLKHNSLVLGGGVYLAGHGFKLIINDFANVYFDVIHHIVEIVFDLLDGLIDLVFLMVLSAQLATPQDIHVAFDLMVDVIVRSNGSLEVLVPHTFIGGFDYPYHLSTH